MTEKTIKLEDLIIKEEYKIRQLNEAAIERYIDLFNSGKTKNIKVQAKTNIVIDGFHRIEAATRAGLDKIKVDIIDIPDDDLRSKAFEYNKSHGVPLSKEERNEIIKALYLKDGKTQIQISDLIGLSQSRISEIIGNIGADNSDIDIENNNQAKKELNMPPIARLLLHGEKQEDVALKFGVSQSTISNKWGEFRDNVFTLYTDERKLKSEIAVDIGLNLDEVDLILQTYGDPLNFEQMISTWWPTFGLDNRFGKKHPSNIPSDLVKNILALYSKPGEIILDPAAGGGVVLDVCKDMINRTCYAYDLTPARKDIKTHNLINGPPATQEKPNLIFLDLPYGPMLEGQYSDAPDDLSNKSIEEYLEAISKIFGYWETGTLVVLMASYRKGGIVTDLPYESEKRMIENGWTIKEHIVNENGPIKSETAATKASAKKHRWLMRKHIHIIIGEKQ